MMSKNFIKCGTLGWCMEIIFTGLHSLKKRENSLTAHTSIWMFPIYGAACLLTPLFRLMNGRSVLLRGWVYACCIFLGEYTFGSILKRHRACPWDYSDAKYNVDGLIRLDYAPLWFGAGLLFEKIIK